MRAAAGADSVGLVFGTRVAGGELAGLPGLARRERPRGAALKPYRSSHTGLRPGAQAQARQAGRSWGQELSASICCLGNGCDQLVECVKLVEMSLRSGFSVVQVEIPGRIHKSVTRAV